MIRRALMLLAGLGLLMGFAQAPAQADAGILKVVDGCSATHNHNAVRSGETLRVYIGYSTASGGTNCAWVEKTANTGTRTDLGIALAKCQAGNYDGRSSCPMDGNWAVDRGEFYEYAGAVRKTGTAGRCIWIEIAYRGSGWSNPFPVHHCS